LPFTNDAIAHGYQCCQNKELSHTHAVVVGEVRASEISEKRTVMATLMQMPWGRWELEPDLCTESCVRGLSHTRE